MQKKNTKRGSFDHNEDFSDEELSHFMNHETSKLSLDEHESISGMLSAFGSGNEVGFLPQNEQIKPECALEELPGLVFKEEAAIWQETPLCSLVVTDQPAIYRKRINQENYERLRIPKVGNVKVKKTTITKSQSQAAAPEKKPKGNKMKYKINKVFADPQGTPFPWSIWLILFCLLSMLGLHWMDGWMDGWCGWSF